MAKASLWLHVAPASWSKFKHFGMFLPDHWDWCPAAQLKQREQFLLHADAGISGGHGHCGPHFSLVIVLGVGEAGLLLSSRPSCEGTWGGPCLVKKCFGGKEKN